MLKLHFAKGRDNAKLYKLERKLGRLYTFSILSGHNCPYAKECKSQVNEVDGKLKLVDGPHRKFRCFSASMEVFFTRVYAARKTNTGIVELAAVNKDEAVSVILTQLPPKCKVMRLHVGGDFKTQAYFDTWLMVAQQRPDILFYGYTKSLPFWVKRLSEIPSNFRLVASKGGHRDDLIEKHGLRFAKVVYNRGEARKDKLSIDHDDTHAATGKDNFALLIHGIQPKGSEAAAAVGPRFANITSYSLPRRTKNFVKAS